MSARREADARLGTDECTRFRSRKVFCGGVLCGDKHRSGVGHLDDIFESDTVKSDCIIEPIPDNSLTDETPGILSNRAEPF